MTTFTANTEIGIIIQAATSWLSYVFAMCGLGPSPILTFITPDWVTGFYSYLNRSIILYGAKQAVFSYEIVLVDFVVGALMLPVLLALVMGLVVLASRWAYKVGRHGPGALVRAFYAVLASGWLYCAWMMYVVWRTALLLLFKYPQFIAVSVALYGLLMLKTIFLVIWYGPTFILYGGWVQIAWFIYDTPQFLRWLSSVYSGRSTSPLGVEQGFGATRVNQALGYGQSLSLQEGIPHVSASGALSQVPRLRVRGRATRMLQKILNGPVGSVGKFMRGRWTPDLPSSVRSPELNALLACSTRGTKLLGIGAVHTTSQSSPVIHVYVVVETPEGRELVIPSLDAKLAQYSFLRERTPELFRGLRTRAVDWFKQEELPLWLGPLVLPGAVARACLTTAPEEAAVKVMADAGLETLRSESG